jgi:hypothetical protein
MTPEQQAYAMQQVIAGVPQRAIAAELGTSHTSIYRATTNNDEIRAKIEAAKAELAERAYGKAINNIIYAVDNYQVPKDAPNAPDYQLREHGYRASIEIGRSIGILASNTQPAYITQIYNDNRVQISPSIQELISSQMSAFPEDPVDVDADNLIDMQRDNKESL